MDLYRLFGVTKKHVGVSGPLAMIFNLLMTDAGKYKLKKLPHWIKQEGSESILQHVYLHRLAMTCKFYRQFVRNWRMKHFPVVVQLEKSISTQLCGGIRERKRRIARYEKRSNAKLSLMSHLLDQFTTLEGAKKVIAEMAITPDEHTHAFEIGRVKYYRQFSSVGFENIRLLNEANEVMLEIPLQNVVKHYSAHQILRVHNQFINPKSARFLGSLANHVERLLEIDYLHNKNTHVLPMIRYENIGDEVVYTLLL